MKNCKKIIFQYKVNGESLDSSGNFQFPTCTKESFLDFFEINTIGKSKDRNL